MIYCIRCGKPNENHYNFCIECGSVLYKPSQKVRQQQIANVQQSIVPAAENHTITSYNDTRIKNNTQSNLPNTCKHGWEISVSFGKSTSANFDRALYLAEHADRYEKTEYNGKEVHQAFFSSVPKSYLSFIKLYELVSGWKSTSVTINGEFVDRKIVSGLNYCYGDRCRTGRTDFCYGASYMTENPFGCHRLQMSSCNHPWWSFSYFNGRNYTVDKKAILERAITYSTAYRMCPCFDWDAVVHAIEQLPNTIQNPNEYGYIG